MTPEYAPTDPFGRMPVPSGVEVVALSLPVGLLTALHARPVGAPRGVVLFVPGFTGSKEDFLDFLPLVAAEGWEAWAYSQRGQADSVAPVGVDEYSLDAFAGDLLAVARQVGQGRPVHLVGHSFGGIVARAAAIASPALFADITLLCSGPHGWPRRNAKNAALVRAKGSAAWWDRDNPLLVGRPDDELTADQAFRRLRLARTSDENLLGAIRILADETDTTADLAATALPVLVAHGVDDAAWPQDWQRAMAARLDAPYLVIPGAAHSPQRENPGATAAVLHDFWGRQAPAAPDPTDSRARPEPGQPR
ncbi:alpha/beta hydrolase [Cryobacterium sp. Sr8]|uniref:alpha/beta fold hydrolase n=1 Tax=Cryobacterium sp. Sr8 TaxID=1259203 RepID=UPI00106DB44A|nr:alpha/beta hydrolase [Cryobacterium sp. Sr8]TFD77290.1 alpha/beta hydrolase [Cryobacterium sp. Sr8]